MDQDWNTVIIYGNQNKKHFKNKQSNTNNKRSLNEEEEDSLKRISRETATIIRNARIARGFRTQKDLANATGISVKVINQYEAGGVIVDNSILQILRRILRVKIPST